MVKISKRRYHRQLKRLALNSVCIFTLMCSNNNTILSNNKNNLNPQISQSSFDHSELELNKLDLTDQELNLIEQNPDILYVYIDSQTANLFNNNISADLDIFGIRLVGLSSSGSTCVSK